MKTLLGLFWALIIIDAGLTAQTPDINLSITVTDYQGTVQNLNIGLDKGATDNVDAAVGEQEAPPFPAGDGFTAQFELADSYVYKDYRGWTGQSEITAQHILKFQTKTGENITLNWALPEGITGRINDLITGTFLDVPMTGKGSTAVSSGFGKVKITITYNFGSEIPTSVCVKTISEGLGNEYTFDKTNIKFSGDITASAPIAVMYYDYEPSNSALPDTIHHVSKYYWKITNFGSVFTNGKISIPIAALVGLDNVSELVWMKRENQGEGWTKLGCSVVNGNTISSQCYFTSFSEFAIGSKTENNPLPVEMAVFTAKRNKEMIELKWITVTEINNYGFEIERSIKNSNDEIVIDWEKIGFVSGNGNSNKEIEYVFSDNKYVIDFINEYRLKQIDNDGKTQYSKILRVEVQSDFIQLFQNYPNPFNPVCMISYSLDKPTFVSLKVFNILGKEIAELVHEKQQTGKYTVEFKPVTLSSGVYIYQLSTGKHRQIRKMTMIK